MKRRIKKNVSVICGNVLYFSGTKLMRKDIIALELMGHEVGKITEVVDGR